MSNRFQSSERYVAKHPLRRLLSYAAPHRRQMLFASVCSVLNKVFDLGPPVLIGAAVDVIVQQENSFLAGFGIVDVWLQLLVLSGVTFVLRNVALLVGDGSIGWKKFAPYDLITVSAASPSVPTALLDQLAEDGRMLIPVGSRKRQELILIRREGKDFTQDAVRDECTFVPLVGSQGWGEGMVRDE